MKRILYLAIALLTSFGAIAQTVGIKVAAPIIKNNPIDNTVTGYANLLNGGYHTVTTKAGRDSLVTAYNKVLNTGMVTYVVSVDSTYRWNGSSWLGLGKGTVSSVNALTLGTSGTDLNSTVSNSTTTPTITLNVPDASDTNRGVVTTGTQNIAGRKNFINPIYLYDRLIIANTLPATPGAFTLLSRDNATGFINGENGSNLPISTATQTALNAKANDNAVVHLAGNETITGVKTYTQPIKGVVATAINELTTKGQVSDSLLNYQKIGGIFGNGVPMPTQTIVGYGNSITRGSGSNVDSTAYFPRLVKAYNAISDNRGQNSEYITYMITNWASVPSYTSSIRYITLMWGTNEYSLQMPLATYRAYYNAVVDSLVSLKNYPLNKIVIVGMPWRGDLGLPITPAQYAAIDALVASDKGTKFIETFNTMNAAGADKLISDGTHPNNEGHTVILNKIISTLNDAELSTTVVIKTNGLDDYGKDYSHFYKYNSKISKGFADANYMRYNTPNYIKNQVGFSQPADIWISRTFRVDGTATLNGTVNTYGTTQIFNYLNQYGSALFQPYITGGIPITTIAGTSSDAAISAFFKNGNNDGVAVGFNTTAGGYLQGYNSTSTLYKPLLLNPSGQNILAGTTTDNGVDKLQVNGSVLATNFKGAGTGLTGTASSLSIGGNAATATTATNATTVTNGVYTTTFNGLGDARYLQLTGGTIGGNLAVTGTSQFTGNLGIGQSSQTSTNIQLSSNITGNTVARGMDSRGIIQNGVTSVAYYFEGLASTAASAFTLGDAVLYGARVNSIGAGSSISRVTGFWAEPSLIGGGSTYGFRGSVPSGTNRWNTYNEGTASNYFNGTTLIGTLTDNGVDKLQVTGSASVSTRFGIGSTSTSTFLNLPSGTTTSSSLRIPASVAPTTPIDGDIWRLTGRTQLYDGTVTKDVLFDKANSVFADGIVGAIVSDGAGNFSKAPIADRVISGVLTTKTSAYTVTLSDVGSNGTVLVRGDATSAAFTITLPVASTTTGLTFIIKKIDSSANGVTVSVASTIDGVATKVFNTQYSGASIMSNGTNYNIVGTF